MASKNPPMPADYEAEASRIATRVSWAYARRCKWADQKDLENQCWLIAIEVYWQYVDQGCEFESPEAYSTLAYVACMRQMSRVLPRMQAPVFCSDHDVKKMSALTRAVSLETALVLRDEQERADKSLIIAELRHKIRQRIFQLMGSEPAVEASTSVFLDGFKPAEVAKIRGLDVSAIYKCNDWLINLSRADQELGMLATQLGEERNWI